MGRRRNIGYTALIYEPAVGAEGRVLAFEPNCKTFAYLQRTVEDRPRIRTFALAIGDRGGGVLFREEDFLDRSAVIDGKRTDLDSSYTAHASTTACSATASRRRSS